MTQTWQVFGHQKAKNILSQQLSSLSLPHAYLFSGPSGVGKKLLALEFAKKVLKTQKLQNHPDFQSLDLGEGTEITLEPLVGFTASLGYKPFLGGKKIAIINNAENLNPQASNALLKTLEEPSESTVIILVAGSSRLLPTIVSRCVALSFGAFTPKALEEFAAAFKLKISPEILALSFGRPAKLKRLAEDPQFFEQQNASVDFYKRLSSVALGEKLALLNNLAQEETLELGASLEAWLFWQAGQVEKAPGDFVKLRALADALAGLGRNFNKKLVLQDLMMRI